MWRNGRIDAAPTGLDDHALHIFQRTSMKSLWRGHHWIMDGDLGPYDVVEVRLRAADTVTFLDFSFLCCARRAIRRSRERIDFWWWILAYQPTLVRDENGSRERIFGGWICHIG